MILTLNEERKLSGTKDTIKWLTWYLNSLSELDKDKEHLWTIGLDRKNKVKFIDLTHIGDMRGVIMSPVQIFRVAIILGTDRIIIAHNHPSGDVEPSKQDKANAFWLSKGGLILGIEIVDNLIIDLEGNYHSIELKEPPYEKSA